MSKAAPSAISTRFWFAVIGFAAFCFSPVINNSAELLITPRENRRHAALCKDTLRGNQCLKRRTPLWRGVSEGSDTPLYAQSAPISCRFRPTASQPRDCGLPCRPRGRSVSRRRRVRVREISGTFHSFPPARALLVGGGKDGACDAGVASPGRLPFSLRHCRQAKTPAARSAASAVRH